MALEEPGSRTHEGSIAISLKRIADSLERLVKRDEEQREPTLRYPMRRDGHKTICTTDRCYCGSQ